MYYALLSLFHQLSDIKNETNSTYLSHPGASEYALMALNKQ